MVSFFESIMLAMAVASTSLAHACAPSLQVSVHADSLSVEMGRSVILDVTVQDRAGAPAMNCLLLAVDPFASWFGNVRRDELIAGRILPANTKDTLNEELQWLHDYFIRNPRFHDLWVVHEGKPLVMVLYTGAQPAEQMPGLPVDTSGFTVRYVGTQLQATHVDQFGHWSWMDGVAEPIVTYANGRAEAVTPTAAFFTLDLAGVAHGAHVASVVAEGAVTRYPLARDRMDARLPDAVPVRVDIPFSFIKNAL
jgi:hypothetical protein